MSLFLNIFVLLCANTCADSVINYYEDVMSIQDFPICMRVCMCVSACIHVSMPIPFVLHTIRS